MAVLLDNFIGASADLEAAERLHKARAELAQQQMRNPLEPLLLKATRRAREKRLACRERSDSESEREATRRAREERLGERERRDSKSERSNRRAKRRGKRRDPESGQRLGERKRLVERGRASEKDCK